jgi:hypothetical protein
VPDHGGTDESGQPLPFTVAQEGEGVSMRLARIYDGVQGGPHFADSHRRIEDPAERELIAGFLRGGRAISRTSGRDTDRVVPDRGEVVPLSFRTDGHWVWSEALGYYLEIYGMAPEPEFVRHIAGCGYQAAEPDAAALRAAAAAVRPHQS